MSLKAGYKGIKDVGTGLNLDQNGSLSLDPAIPEVICTEETEGSYFLVAIVDSDGEVTYSWEALES